MNRIVLVRYGEIILKGMNRPVFESLLVKNIKKALSDECPLNIHWAQATIYIEPEDDSCVESIVEKLKKVFGIVSIVVAYPAQKDIDNLEEVLKNNFASELSAASTFKVIAKRSDKTFHMTSPQICEEIGGRLLEAFPNLTVDVHNPEINVYVEIRENGYVHLDRIPGAGGMPSGSNGKAMLLLSGGIDSPVAGYMIGKRGVYLEAVHFFSYPYTSDRAKDKVLELAKELAAYTGSLKVHVVPFTDIQLQIRDKCPEEHLTLVMRRFMMQISQRLAERRGCSALITGESIGQVASQTMGALAVTDDAVTMPVFRPLIGMDKEEIVEISRKIGTYETSILPYEDCCTVFTPRHPSTKPKLEKILLSQSKLDVERLINEAVEGTETLEV
ncbi:MAG: tRNA 4-thiouridine(8) synthase ThiI [Ruminococcaceae bacterium]|nr:tRNA 4-thiouridine(8) synthase ThiI [Oscillospiraceae bacterium]